MLPATSNGMQPEDVEGSLKKLRLFRIHSHREVRECLTCSGVNHLNDGEKKGMEEFNFDWSHNCDFVFLQGAALVLGFFFLCQR
jgi:hypothetical protein